MEKEESKKFLVKSINEEEGIIEISCSNDDSHLFFSIEFLLLEYMKLSEIDEYTFGNDSNR